MKNLCRLIKNEHASIPIIIAAAVLPLIIMFGVAFDYGRVLWIKRKLDYAMDATTLFAVSKPMSVIRENIIKKQAESFFRTQVESLRSTQNIHLDTVSLNVSSYANGQRVSTLSIKATVPLLFASFFDIKSIKLSNESKAINGVSPNIDFHLLLDTSPSMAIPTTSEGLAILANSNAPRCTFACHSIADTRGVRKDGSIGDLYSTARSYNLFLRSDAEAKAVRDLAVIAQKAEKANKATYRFSISEFNIPTNFKTRLQLTSDLSEVDAAVENLDPPLYYSDNCQISAACSKTDPGFMNRATASDDAMTKMNRLMKDPGSGTDKNEPQSVMLMITDGMRDETRSADIQLPDFGFNTRYCDMIKKRGIRIGILYTVYSKESLMDGGWSQTRIVPRLHELEDSLRQCASEGLFIPVETGGDISDALTQLFKASASSAKLFH